MTEKDGHIGHATDRPSIDDRSSQVLEKCVLDLDPRVGNVATGASILVEHRRSNRTTLDGVAAGPPQSDRAENSGNGARDVSPGMPGDPSTS
jgi:hypothetical protein